MRSTFHGLETAKRALFAQQYALHTLGHNIANANTKGYSRQRVNFGTMSPLDPLAASRSAIPGQMGTGVIVQEVVRMREDFLDSQFRKENERFGEWDVRLDTLEKLEAMFHEPSDDGLAAIIDEFWAAWDTLSEAPEKNTNRVVVVEKMRTMVETFNIRASQLDDLEQDLQKSLAIKYDRANELLEDVARLNGQIAKIEASGDQANDLRDTRDMYVDELSKLVAIQAQENADGAYTILLTTEDDTVSGPELIRGETFTPLASGEQTVIGGEINGLHQSLAQVGEYRIELDTMVRTMAEGRVAITLPAGTVLADDVTFVDEDGEEVTIGAGELTEPQSVFVNGVNGLHALGYDAEGEPGEALFISADGESITAGNIRVSEDLLQDETLLAPANRKDEDGVLESSNGIALLLARLKEDGNFQFANGDGEGTENATIAEGTIGDYYNAYSSKVGIQTDSAKRALQNQATVLNTIDMRRASVSDVSLDEELGNMIMFQHAYNAAARSMTVVDEMLDRVINGMGHVGR